MVPCLKCLNNHQVEACVYYHQNLVLLKPPQIDTSLSSVLRVHAVEKLLMKWPASYLKDLWIFSSNFSKWPFLAPNCNCGWIWIYSCICSIYIWKENSVSSSRLDYISCRQRRVICRGHVLCLGKFRWGAEFLTLPQTVRLCSRTFMLNNCSEYMMLLKPATRHCLIEDSPCHSMTARQHTHPMWPYANLRNLRGWKGWLNLSTHKDLDHQITNLSRAYLLSDGFPTMGMRLKMDAGSVSELKTSQNFKLRIEIPAQRCQRAIYLKE